MMEIVSGGMIQGNLILKIYVKQPTMIPIGMIIHFKGLIILKYDRLL